MGWGGWGEREKRSSPDDAVKLKSFDLCPNPICIAPTPPRTTPTIPPPRKEAVVVFFLASAQRKSTISLCGCSCPSVGSNGVFPSHLYGKNKTLRGIITAKGF